ncbi:MAG: aminopeptidase P family protein [Sphingomonadaceae bacterium]|nr:aminopeptidase P family protein [Sphingomonadaceae bacterium]
MPQPASLIPQQKLEGLRGELRRRGIDGFIVPICDEHMSEYVGAYAQRLHWLTGFNGSAGTGVVLADKAAIAVDGRYELQVRAQVPGALYTYLDIPKDSLGRWIAENAAPGARIGYDPWLHDERWLAAMGKLLAERDIALVATTPNPIDAVWHDQPVPSEAPAFVMADAAAGRSSAEKRSQIIDWLKEKRLDATVMTALDSISWTFNIRGGDVSRTPVALAFALLHADGTTELFIDDAKLTPDVRAHLGNAVRTAPRFDIVTSLDALAGKRVAVDPERTVLAIIDRLEKAGAILVRERDPAVLAKAVKNPVEIAGMKAAHVRDGVAVTRFLRWVEAEAPKGELDELGAAAKLLDLRREAGAADGHPLVDLSFDTITGAGPNGALMHYRVNEETNRRLESGNLYLCDSGGQYGDGTTDITRTIAVGQPTAEMRRRFTQVLQGHIALATARFPHGTRGSQIDAFARMFLWADGVDYGHGTGHGVGHFLAVHEGPQRIAKPAGGQAGTDEPLRAGMILSNEPGYYKPGHFGIRIENLVIVIDVEIAGAEQPMLGFETITFAPLDRSLIDTAMLSEREIHWVDQYHADVMDRLGPTLSPDERGWLADACRPLRAGV